MANLEYERTQVAAIKLSLVAADNTAVSRAPFLDCVDQQFPGLREPALCAQAAHRTDTAGRVMSSSKHPGLHRTSPVTHRPAQSVPLQPEDPAVDPGETAGSRQQADGSSFLGLGSRHLVFISSLAAVNALQV